MNDFQILNNKTEHSRHYSLNTNGISV